MANRVLPVGGDVRVGVAAAPEALWRFVVDPAVVAACSPELQEAHVDGAGPLQRGSVIVGRSARGDRSWTTRSTVLECDAPHRLVWATGDPPSATWTLEVTAVPGGSALRHAVELHDGAEPFASAIAREPERSRELVQGRLDELLGAMATTARGLAALAEGAPLPGG